MTIYYKEGFKYQLSRVHSFTLPKRFKGIVWADDFLCVDGGIVYVRKGYAWDGPSGPAIDTENFMQGSLRHDVKYQLMRLKVLPQSFRAEADTQLVEDCRNDGMCYVRQKWVYVGVKYGAAFAANPDNVRKVQEAGQCVSYIYA